MRQASSPTPTLVQLQVALVTSESATEASTPDMAPFSASLRPSRALGTPSTKMPTTCEVVGTRKRPTSIEFSRTAHLPSPTCSPSTYSS